MSAVHHFHQFLAAIGTATELPVRKRPNLGRSELTSLRLKAVVAEVAKGVPFATISGIGIDVCEQ